MRIALLARVRALEERLLVIETRLTELLAHVDRLFGRRRRKGGR